MPRRNLIRSNQSPYHVTIRCNNREWFSLPLNTVWDYCLQSFKYANGNHPVKLQAFVLMSNHYHMLIWTPNADLDKFMFSFNRRLSQLIRYKTKRVNRIFGDRYKWSIIDDEIYYSRALKYIYRNPLEVNMVRKCEDYPFSTLNYVVNNQEFVLPLFNSYFGNRQLFLKWVNEDEDRREDYKTKLALSRPVFRLPSDNTLTRHNGRLL